MTRFTTSLLLSALFVGAFAITEASAQAVPGHAYTIRYHKVHPGKTAEYNALYANVVRPVLDKLKADGDIVSYIDLLEVYGDHDATHIIITEVENVAATEIVPGKLEAAAQELFGQSFQEALGDLTVLREFTGTELFRSITN